MAKTAHRITNREFQSLVCPTKKMSKVKDYYFPDGLPQDFVFAVYSLPVVSVPAIEAVDTSKVVIVAAPQQQFAPVAPVAKVAPRNTVGRLMRPPDDDSLI